ncbi:2OG-Fe dioxygenase family protein [Henriciella aquimarina]|uniref:2OG-Fe dioxygenase family protein n=1 Tax=Henriciella aquimarina TaxID=545261 RepID=UPI000A054FC3|nr:2OG-Fe dioxygenase family protein [Henriciella aquimarina]
MHSGQIAHPAPETEDRLVHQLERDGYAVLPAADCIALLGGRERLADAIPAFRQSWDDLPLDPYMADGGRYRRRRHAVMSAAANGGPVRLEPYRPHFQTRHYNPVNGGIERHFEEIRRETLENRAGAGLLDLGARVFSAAAPQTGWEIEVHQFRIEAGAEGGQPTPEGMHRDGVDFVLMSLIAREGVSGGESLIEDNAGHPLTRFTLTAPFDTALVDDRRLRHGVSCILPAVPLTRGHRDMLVVTFRRTD